MKKIFKIYGPTPLSGEIKISGSKNAALPILFASLLTNEDIKIKNIPNLKDIKITLLLFKKIGVKIKKSNNTIFLNSKNIFYKPLTNKLIKKIRASIWLLSPILVRFKKITLSTPGGCKIGNRPIDIHLYVLKRLGIKIKKNKNFIKAKINKNILNSNIIKLPKISVGATITLILAVILKTGLTIIKNPAKEPEIIDTINFLNNIGSKIHIDKKKNIIKIIGVKKLTGGTYKIIPDRIETGTFLISAIISKKKITCYNTNSKLLSSIIKKLKMCGAKIKKGNDFITLNMNNKKPKSINIETSPYPGIPTDIQPIFTLLNSISIGKSTIKENIFKNRFSHVNELIKMGAKIKIKNNKIICNGVNEIFGSKITAKDLRCSITLVLAGCIANGITIIKSIKHIYRGYENIEKKLKTIGAKIKKI